VVWLITVVSAGELDGEPNDATLLGSIGCDTFDGSMLIDPIVSTAGLFFTIFGEVAEAEGIPDEGLQPS
jgi:hypothetical protein